MNLSSIIEEALFWAQKEEKVFRLSEGVQQINGMSSVRIRVLLNEVCRMMGEDCRYVEVGTWRGSTLISAGYKNTGLFYGVDNFSQYFRKDRTRIVLHENIRKFWWESKPIFIESDIFKLDLKLLPKMNVFFYDAGHTRDEHHRGLKRFSKKFDNEVILIVDDWSRKSVWKGTQLALKDMKFDVISEQEIKTDKRDDEDGFWNGVYLAHLIRK